MHKHQIAGRFIHAILWLKPRNNRNAKKEKKNKATNGRKNNCKFAKNITWETTKIGVPNLGSVNPLGAHECVLKGPQP